MGVLLMRLFLFGYVTDLSFPCWHFLWALTLHVAMKGNELLLLGDVNEIVWLNKHQRSIFFKNIMQNIEYVARRKV